MSYAWLFPGQGAQSVSMGKALYDESARARDVFQRCDEALGFSISKLCFEGPDEQLVLTQNTQPAIVATSIAAFEALLEAHPDLPAPAFAAGHSLGEYSALVAAGAMSVEDAVRVVRVRGAAMQEAVPAGQGKMAAIMGGNPETVSQLCVDAAEGRPLSPANYNAPGQVVIAGESAAVDRAVALSKDRGLKAIPLKVSAPFHCALMAPAADRVREALSEITLRPASVPIVANVDASPHQDPETIIELLIRQVDNAVLWDRSISFMASAGVDRAIEVGPGKVLAGLVKRIDRSIRVQSIGRPEDVAQAARLWD